MKKVFGRTGRPGVPAARLAPIALALALAPGVRSEPARCRVAWMQGEPYATFADLCRHADLAPSQRSPQDVRLLGGRPGRFEFLPDGRRMLAGGTLVWLQFPVLKQNGDWLMRTADAQSALLPLADPPAALAGREARVVVLDPGHGGRDGGAVGPGGVVEKEVVLDVALRVRERLRGASFEVVLTREADEFLELEDRCLFAARRRADLFVSIHLNSTDEPGVNGIETFVLTSPSSPSTGSPGYVGRHTTFDGNEHDGANTVLGYHLQRRVIERTGAEDRGLRRARFAVLRDAPCASALIECAFLSNHREERGIRDPAYRDRIAEGIAAGLLDYAADVRRARWRRLD